MNWRRIIRSLISVRTESRMKRGLYRVMPLRHRSFVVNVFHCCVHKTASQWLRAVLSDPAVYRHSGLLPYHYQSEQSGGEGRPITQRSFELPFPAGTIVSPLYIDFANFATVPKSGAYRAFFVQRDPRDILVSWYFSTRYSHPTRYGRLEGARAQLGQLSPEDGLVQCVDDLERMGLFAALRSWVDAPRRDPHTLLVRYEDLVGADAAAHCERLLLHCDIPLGREAITRLLQRYRFERMSGGRGRGDEDKLSKYRKGQPGDWVNHFTPRVAVKFEAVAGDLVAALGYAAPPRAAG
jgi:hypothetical protein